MTRSAPASAVALLVALCLLLAGVAPSVSQVLAASAAADVCHAGPAGGPEPGGDPPASHEAACALCLAHGGSNAAPPPAVGAGPASIGRATPELPASSGVWPGPGWNAPSARGPPGASPA